MSMADRIVVMRDGRVAQVDTPERLFNAPNSAWVCEFVGGGNLLRGALEPARTGHLRLHVAPGSVFEVASGPGAVVQVPFDKIRLQPSAEGLPVTGRRFLGAIVEVQLASPAGVVCAHLPPSDAAAFPVGARAHIAADPAHCRLLPDR